MELFVATWTVRFALVGAVGVAGISLASGSLVPDAVIRAVLVAFVFTIGGRLLIGALETPEHRVARLRRERARKAGGRGGRNAAASSTPARSMARPMNERVA